MLKKRKIKYILIIYLIKILSQKNCGLIKIFSDEKQINSITPFSYKKKFDFQKNGKFLTISGFFLISDKRDRNSQILKISTNSENSQKKYDFVKVEYNKLFKNSEIVITFPKNEKFQKKVIKEKIELPIGSYVFLSISLNFEKNLFNFILKGIEPEKFLFKKNYEINFSENFEILENIDFNFGCYEKKIDECFIGNIKNFNFFLNYEENLENLFFLKSENFSENFLFDISKNSKKDDFLSKNQNKKISYKISGKKIFSENPENHIIFKGGNKIEIENIKLFDFLEIIESPTIYFVFLYKEPLPDLFPIFFQKKFSEKNQIEIFLKKNGNMKRSILVKFFGKKIFESENYFEEKKIHNFSISFLRERTFLRILFINKIKKKISEKKIFPGIENGKIELLNTKIKFVGEFFFYQFNIIKNSSGVILSENLKKNKNCEKKKKLFIFFIIF